MGLTAVIQRYRHSRGFGVHSPFGYEIVTRCVRPVGLAWYGYEEIDACESEGADRKTLREARLLLRLFTMMKPRHVFIPESADDVYRVALAAYDSRAVAENRAEEACRCEAVCSIGESIGLEILARVVMMPGHWLAVKDVPSGWADKLFDVLPEGMMLEGPANMLVFNRPGMQKQRYEMPVG